MSIATMKGVAIGGLAMVVLSAGGYTGYRALVPAAADVLSVKEVTATVSTPREECREVQVQKQAPVQDPNRVAGTLIGGVAGGLLGNQVGGGRGKTAATVVGAAAGAYAGNQVQKNMQQKDVVTGTEVRCRTVYDKSQKVVGYDVAYRLDGKDGTVRMSFDPDRKIPVKDGQLVLTPPQPAS